MERKRILVLSSSKLSVCLSGLVKKFNGFVLYFYSKTDEIDRIQKISDLYYNIADFIDHDKVNYAIIDLNFHVEIRKVIEERQKNNPALKIIWITALRGNYKVQMAKLPQPCISEEDLEKELSEAIQKYFE